ncbi:MAG: hypothetical protein WC527_07095 [Candidatus Margulisiibacteriota bacterium]
MKISSLRVRKADAEPSKQQQIIIIKDRLTGTHCTDNIRNSDSFADSTRHLGMRMLSASPDSGIKTDLAIKISGLRVRATDGDLSEGDQTEIVRSRLKGTMSGDNRRQNDSLSHLGRNLGDRELTAPQIELTKWLSMEDILVPEVISVPGMPLAVMRGLVTAGQFLQFTEDADYVIEGDEAEVLKAVLANTSNSDKYLGYLGLFDAREYAKWLSARTGRTFRVPFDDEWCFARETVGKQLLGVRFGELIEQSLAEAQKNCSHRRSLPSGHRVEFNEKHRGGALRLVETKGRTDQADRAFEDFLAQLGPSRQIERTLPK